MNTDLVRRRLLKAGAAAASLPLIGRAPFATAAGRPRGLHVSYTGNIKKTRTVTWFTDGLKDPGSVIQYGPVTPGMTAEDIASAPLPLAVSGSSRQTFNVPVLTHSAKMVDIDPSLPVRYRVGSSAGWSEVKVLAPAASADGTFSFCHFGDMDITEASTAVRNGVVAMDPDFVILAGDLAYTSGFDPKWDAWFEHIEPMAATRPLMTAPGNHESEGNGGRGYRSRFTQPGKNIRYGWDYHNIHFLFATGGALVGVQPEYDYEMIEELQEMEQDLADAAARRAAGEIDFIILVQHYPIWTSEEDRAPAKGNLVLLEEDMLLRYGVDLALFGHDHLYQRSKQMAYGKPNDYGYIQVTNGGGGRGTYEFADEIGEWSAVNTVRYGFSRYKVNADHITVRSYAVDEPDNSITDGVAKEIDNFSVTARSMEERQRYAQPARKNLIDAELAAELIEHTRQRNYLHDLGELKDTTAR